MLVSDFKVKSGLKNTQRHFNGIHGIPLTRMHKKKETLSYNGVVTLFASTTKLLDIKYEFYGSGGDLIETSNCGILVR